MILAVVMAVSMMLAAMPVGASGNYLAIGDSITTGYGLDDETKGFASVVASANGLALSNKAVNGSTAVDVLAQLTSGALDTELKSARIITLTCGGNDMINVMCEQVAEKYNKNSDASIAGSDVMAILMNSADSRRISLAVNALSVLNGDGSGIPAFADSQIFSDALNVYAENLGAIISYIRTVNPSAGLVVTTQYNPYKWLTGYLAGVATGINGGVDKLNSVIVEVCEQNGCEVADIYQAFEASQTNLSNADVKTLNMDFHPNAEGHAVIAECVNAVVGSLMAETPETPVTEWNNPFEDVTQNDWFYDSVQFVSQNGLFNGVSISEFAPNSPMSRAMLVTVLHRAEGSPEPASVSTFTDVASGAYYEKAVSWAFANGIITGYSDTQFAPDDNITREQIAAIMLRYATYKGNGPVGAWAIRLDYADLDQVSDYAAEAVMYCTMKGIMQGKGNNMFAPKDHATRAEFATVLKKYIENNQ